MRDTITPPILVALFDYWDGKRNDRPMPARDDIDPVEIPRLLPNVYLVDVGETILDYRFRLMGTAAVEGFGEDRTGRDFTILTKVDNSARVLSEYEAVVQSAHPGYLDAMPISREDFHRIYYRLILPLSDDGTRVNMLLCGAHFEPAERGSRW